MHPVFLIKINKEFKTKFINKYYKNSQWVQINKLIEQNE